MKDRVDVMAKVLDAILEEFASVMGKRAAYGIAKRGALKVLSKHREVVLKKLKEQLPPEFLEGL
jgi:hypothetical protein